MRKSPSTFSRKAQRVNSYTHDQLRTLILLQRIHMSWVMFWFSLLIFIVILSALFYSMLANKGDVWTRIVLALLNGIVGSNVRQMVFFLFTASAGKS